MFKSLGPQYLLQQPDLRLGYSDKGQSFLKRRHTSAPALSTAAFLQILQQLCSLPWAPSVSLHAAQCRMMSLLSLKSRKLPSSLAPKPEVCSTAFKPNLLRPPGRHFHPLLHLRCTSLLLRQPLAWDPVAQVAARGTSSFEWKLSEKPFLNNLRSHSLCSPLPAHLGVQPAVFHLKA